MSYPLTGTAPEVSAATLRILRMVEVAPTRWPSFG